MIFHSKMDSTFKKIMAVMVVFITLLFGSAPFLDSSVNTTEIIILLCVYIAIISFVVWIILGTKYIFKEDYLLVQGGPFRSKIQYKDITKVAKASDLLSGYRLVTSKNALDIMYKTSTFGSVKISPYEQERFIVELKRRCPHIKCEV